MGAKGLAYDPVKESVSLVDLESGQPVLQMPLPIFNEFVVWLNSDCRVAVFRDCLALCYNFPLRSFCFLHNSGGLTDHTLPLLVPHDLWPDFLEAMNTLWKDCQERIIPDTRRMLLEGFSATEIQEELSRSLLSPPSLEMPLWLN